MIKEIDIKAQCELVIPTLSCCIYKPTSDKLESILTTYIESDNKKLYGNYFSGSLIGLIGITSNGSEVEINHLAVNLEFRMKGTGKQLVYFILNEYPDKRVFLETDDEAVEFYKSIGFQINHLGEKYPGNPRYLCIWKNEGKSE